MINEIIEGITTALDALTEGECEIYTEDSKQGLEEPCFFVNQMEVENTRCLGTRMKRKYPFDIIYFPRDSDAKKYEMYEMEDLLQDGMEYITLANGNMLRASDISSEIVDDVLHVYVSYFVILDVVPKHETGMEELKAGHRLKG